MNAWLQKGVQFHLREATPTLTVWAMLFGLLDQKNIAKSPPITEDDVTGLLRDLRAEIEEVRRQLQTNDESKALASTMIGRALNATSVSHLTTDWGSVRQNFLTSDVMTAWAWAAHHLPATEDVPDAKDTEELKQRLTELEETAKADGVPSELRAFVIRQAKAIRDALGRVSVSGTATLAEAVDAGIGEVIRASEEYQAAAQKAPEQSSKLWRKVTDTWESAAKVAGQLDQLQKGLSALSRAYAKVSGYLPFLQD